MFRYVVVLCLCLSICIHTHTHTRTHVCTHAHTHREFLYVMMVSWNKTSLDINEYANIKDKINYDVSSNQRMESTTLVFTHLLFF